MDYDSSIMNRLKNLFMKENVTDDDVAEEIISILGEDAADESQIRSEAEMIRNIFKFKDKNAKDAMTHRKNIVALDGDQTLDEALQFIVNQGNSRFPVYDENIDNIIGVIHLRDAMKCYFHKNLRSRTLKELPEAVRKAYFVPETRAIDRLFHQMKTAKIHMVIVVDEYGQTSGLIAMEDILEEIVGDILDEYDEDEEDITTISDGVYIANGMTELDKLKELLGIEFTEEYETLNGFLIDCLDHIPSNEEKCKVNYQGYLFRVLHVEDKIIQKVRIEKTADEC